MMMIVSYTGSRAKLDQPGVPNSLLNIMRIVEEREGVVELPEIELSGDVVKEPVKQHYGKLIVLFSCRDWLISIGPHYYFFLPTLMLMAGGSLFLVCFVNAIFTNRFFQIFNASFGLLQIGSYLLVALSNPGVIRAAQQEGDASNSSRQLITCDRCGASHHSKRVRHCSYCDVCVRGYDHHCPWVSKCIGSGNYSYFNFFVGITPLYIMYFIVVLLICLSVRAQPLPHDPQM